MSFPPATEMFQFAGFASLAYGFSQGYRSRGGLPHSEIPGSTIARISPGLFAACHVLHRLSVPRHPPDALNSRLSATPNGKNHRETQPCASKALVERCPVGLQPTDLIRGESRGPTMGRQSSLLGGTCKAPPLEDTIGTPHAQTSRPVRRMDPASVTTRLFTSVHQQLAPRIPQGIRQRQCLSSCRVSGSGSPRRAFGETCGFACRPARNCVARVVEVNGIEPMTSCLQSRRSPS